VSLRLAFMGTPAFALPTLKAILEQGHHIAAVYTRAPRQAGRGLAERPSPVHEFASAQGLPIATPASLRSAHVLESFRHLNLDAAVVIAFGLILPKPILEAPRLGCYNVHASLLPRWRGAAPINRAIMAGDRETGITIMRMTEGLDEGPICRATSLSIGATETAGELHDRLAPLGARLMLATLDDLERGILRQAPQPETGATYASKIDKAEAHIDFGRTADHVLCHIHGLSPFPGAWCVLEDGERLYRLKLLKVERATGQGRPGEILDENFTIACGKDAVRPLILQRQGRSPLPRAEFARGLAVAPGKRLA
jgi:methionyl-tRNA formyltransferase